MDPERRIAFESLELLGMEDWILATTNDDRNDRIAFGAAEIDSVRNAVVFVMRCKTNTENDEKLLPSRNERELSAVSCQHCSVALNSFMPLTAHEMPF